MRGEPATLARLDEETAPARASLAAAAEDYRRRRATLLATPSDLGVALPDRLPDLEAALERLAVPSALAGAIAEALRAADGRLVGRPGCLGALDGASSALRDAVNRWRLVAERDDLDGRIAVHEAALAEHRAAGDDRRRPLPGLAPGLGVPAVVREAATRAARTVALERRLDELTGRRRAYDAWLADPDLRVLAFDAERGRVALARGDPDGAAVVGVLVPGAGTTLGRVEGWYGRWRDDLAADLAERRPGETTAVVLWLGYDTPAGPATAAARRRQRGRQAAPDLVAHVDGLRAHGAGEVAVVGHSYGSVVLAEAGSALRADRLAVAGSPGLGVGVDEVDDLGLDAPLHVLTHERDPIRIADLAVGGWAHEHGGAATDVAGVREVALPAGDAAGRSALGVHAAYGAMPASRAALARIVAGRAAGPAGPPAGSRAAGGGGRPARASGAGRPRADRAR